MIGDESSFTSPEITFSGIGRGILNSVVLISTSLLLLLVSCFAFLLFYHHNVPAIGVQQRVYLQHHTALNPHATIDLEFSTSKLSTSQPYDVVVELTLPNTPSNHDIGNFMVELEMMSSTSETIIKTARPTILQYSSPLIDSLSTVLLSAPVLLGFKEESQILRIPLLERYEFESGWLASPSQVRLELHAPGIKVYNSRILFRTHLRGLTWVLYTFKITSFLVFTTLFWLSGMLFMVMAWGLLTFVVMPESKTKNKNEKKHYSSGKGPQSSAIENRPQSRPLTPDSESEDSYETFSQHASITPGNVRFRDGSSRRSQATSSIETQSYFKFEDDDSRDRESVGSVATTMEGDPYIKVEDFD